MAPRMLRLGTKRLVVTTGLPPGAPGPESPLPGAAAINHTGGTMSDFEVFEASSFALQKGGALPLARLAYKTLVHPVGNPNPLGHLTPPAACPSSSSGTASPW